MLQEFYAVQRSAYWKFSAAIKYINDMSKYRKISEIIIFDNTLIGTGSVNSLIAITGS